MGALDDLIAQDEDNMRRAQGRSSELDRLIAMDDARNLPSQDPGDGSEETPSFVGYDPASKPAAEPSLWEGLRSAARDVMDPNAPVYQGMRDWREKDLQANDGVSPINRMAEAVVGTALPGAGKSAGLLTRAAVEGGESMGMSALDKLDEHMRDKSGKPVDLSADARDVAMSGAFGAAGGAASHYIGKAAGAVKDWAGEAAAKAKNLVTGMGVRDAKATAAMHGVDAIDENYGGLLEKYSPSGLTGKSPKAHHSAVLAEKEAVGNDLRGMAKEINTGLVPDVEGAGSLMPGTPGDLGQARAKLEQELRKEAGGVRGLGADKSQYRGALQEMVDELIGTPGQVRTRPREMHRPEPEFPDQAAQAAYDERRALGLERPTEAYWDDVTVSPGRPGTPDSSRTVSGSTSRPVEAFPSLGTDEVAAYAERRGLGLEPPPGETSWTYSDRVPGRPATADRFSATPRSRNEPAPVFEDEGARQAFKERQGLGLEPPTDAYWDEVVSETPGRPGLKPFESFEDMRDQKSALQSFAHSGPGNSVPESAQKQAAALGGRVLKDEASRIVGQAKPELRDRYVAQNQNFAELATLEEMLLNKAAAEASGGDLGGIVGSSAVAGLLGAGTGAVLDDDPISGAAKGGVSGFLAGFGLQGGAGATRTAIRQAGGGRMTDAGANMLRGLERGAGKVEQGLAARSLAGLGSAAGDAQGSTKKPGADVAVGHSKVGKLLKTNPAALGGFASMLQDSADDPLKLSAAISNLARKQPAFRKLLRELEDQPDAPMSRPQSGITYSLEGE